MKNANPDLVVHGAQFEDGVGLTRAMLKAGLHAGRCSTRPTRPSFGDQFVEAIGEENTEGIMYAVSHSPDADTPGNAEFVAKYEEMFGQALSAGGRGRRLRGRARSCRRPSRPSAASTTSRRSPTGCARTRSTRSSARCRGTTTGARRVTS